MNYIEDLAVVFMMLRVRVSTFDEKIARSLGTQAFEKRAFTQKQSEIVLRLLKKYRNQFVKAGYDYIDDLLDNPVFKYPIRTVDQTKEVKIDWVSNRFILKFPFDQKLVNRLREINQNTKLTKALWDSEGKFWFLDLNEMSLQFIVTDLIPKGFVVDEELQQFIDDYNNIQQNFENYIPMMIKNGEEYIFKNIKSEFKSTELKQALVASSKFGVYVYDDQVTTDLTRLNEVEPLTKIFSHNDKQKIFVDNSKYSRREMISLIKDMDCINAVFLYEETSADHLVKWVEDLQSIGVGNEEIAVYFRRKNDEQGIQFNTKVKELGLNKDVTDEKVKWMFFGAKYPKSLIKIKKFADICICENRYVSTHHSVINTMKNSMFTFYHNDHAPAGDEVVKL